MHKSFWNHLHLKVFYLYSMLDAAILFPIVAVANGLIYPRLLKTESDGGQL
ncbi:hypothetical protein L0337_18900 [candidate division KSB1 bacterium]|nr:hypothetical protein [candidate division KSB1 bacterium]